MSTLRTLLGSLALLSLCSAAHAVPLLFSFTETGGTGAFNTPEPDYTLSFVLPFPMMPSGEIPAQYTEFSPVNVTINGVVYDDESLSFGSAIPTFGGLLGGCASLAPNCPASGGGFALAGGAFFTGTTDHPIFTPGSYYVGDSQFAGVGIIDGGTQTLVISTVTAPTPEPASLLLLGTGALSCLALKCRRAA